MVPKYFRLLINESRETSDDYWRGSLLAKPGIRRTGNGQEPSFFDRDAHQSIPQRRSNAAWASISCRSRKDMAIPKFEVLRLRKASSHERIKLVNPRTPRRERLGSTKPDLPKRWCQARLNFQSCTDVTINKGNSLHLVERGKWHGMRPYKPEMNQVKWIHRRRPRGLQP